jgi:hypothetical protein
VLSVILDNGFLEDWGNAELDSSRYLFSSIIFLYDFLARHPEYSKEFNYHANLLEGVIQHLDIESNDLTTEKIFKLLKDMKTIIELVLESPIPVSSEYEVVIESVFSGNENIYEIPERVAFFAMVRISSTLMTNPGSREKALNILIHFYGHLGMYIYHLRDQSKTRVFIEKLIKALTPSLSLEDTYFEFSIAHMMKFENVILEFLEESKKERTPDFKIYSNGIMIGYLECTTRKQKDRNVLEHVVDGLENKASQMKCGLNLIQCLAIHMPYDLKSKKIDAFLVSEKEIRLFDNNGLAFDSNENETFKVGQALRNQNTFTHLLVTSNNLLKTSPDWIGNFPRRRLFGKSTAPKFPGKWNERIFLV